MDKSRDYCNLEGGVGGYVPSAPLPIHKEKKNLSLLEHQRLEEIKKDFEALSGVESVQVVENAAELNGDDDVCCRHLILVRLKTVPLKDKVKMMNEDFYYRVSRFGLSGVELRIEWDNFIFDPPV